MASESAANRLDAAVERIRQDDLNAWSHLDLDSARQAAAASDRRAADARPLRRIDGCLLGVKANIAVAGWPWDGGLRSRKHERAARDAELISALRKAGAILLGQTTMDAGALGASGRSMQGEIRHPLDPRLSVGGSSGGSAAAVAAAHCDAAIGSDTIGSVRIPAALCGVFGFKPSPARLSLRGVIPVHEDFDHLGPISRDPRMARELLVAVGALHATPQPPSPAPRCAVLQSFGEVELDATVESAFRTAMEKLAPRVAAMTELEWPHDATASLDLRKVRRAIFALCEHRMWLAHREQLEQQPEEFDEPLRSMLEFGGRLDDAKLDRYRATVSDFAKRWRELTQGFDAIFLPTSPVTAFAHAEPTPDSLADLTVIATATESPAASVPIPSERLPVGLQIIGKRGADELVIALAERLSD